MRIHHFAKVQKRQGRESEPRDHHWRCAERLMNPVPVVVENVDGEYPDMFPEEISEVVGLAGEPTVESRTGAPTLGSGGYSVAFAPGLSPAPVVTFPVPAHQTGRADFPHPAFGRDHAFALGRLIAVRER